MAIKKDDIPQGDLRYAQMDFSVSAGRLGTTVASVAWSIDEGTSVTISGTPTLNGSIAQALLRAGDNSSGCSLVKVKATMADGQTVSEWIKINVIDPSC